MRHDDGVYVGHMLEIAEDALEIAQGVDRQRFDRDSTIRWALVHLIQVIGEAARHVSDSYRIEHPEVPWPKIVGMRHRIVHDYLNVNYDIVWDVVTQELPELIRIVHPLV